MKLFDYFRSSASYRVRIALNIKGLEYELAEVHLVDNGGEQFSDAYYQLNPQQRVPALQHDGQVMTQSLAIIDYLEQEYPHPALVFGDAVMQAQIRAMAYTIACDIHPLNNLSVLKYLKHTLSVTDQQKMAWYHHWIHLGFATIEQQLSLMSHQGPFCFGDQVSLADVCLVPQVYNAKRFDVDLSAYPTLCAIDQHCLSLPAFINAAP